MTLSPFEVERREFGRKPFGYKPRDVDHFLDEVHRSLSQLWQDRGDVREENERLKERLTRFEQLEDQLKNTLLLAQDSAEKSHEQARRESDLVMREAGQKARDIIHGAHEDKQRLEMVLRDLHSAEQEARQRLRSLAGAIVSHLDDTEQLVAESSSSATLTAVVQAHPEAGALRGAMTEDRLAELVATNEAAAPARITSDSPVLGDEPARADLTGSMPAVDASSPRDAVLNVTPEAVDSAVQAAGALGRDAASGTTADAFFEAPPAFDHTESTPRRESDDPTPSVR